MELCYLQSASRLLFYFLWPWKRLGPAISDPISKRRDDYIRSDASDKRSSIGGTWSCQKSPQPHPYLIIFIENTDFVLFRVFEYCLFNWNKLELTFRPLNRHNWARMNVQTTHTHTHTRSALKRLTEYGGSNMWNYGIQMLIMRTFNLFVGEFRAWKLIPKIPSSNK